jgi:hypothetical protein
MGICVWNFQKAFLQLALLLFGCCIIWNPARAQDQIQSTPAQESPAVEGQSTPRNFSIVNIGLFAGRSGAAIGPSGLVEFDPVRWFGVGVFASESSAAQNMYGGRAYGWSFSTGLLFTVHPPTIKGFTISPFAQVGFNHDHGRLIIPMGDGVYWKDGDNPERYTWTVGPSIERPLFKNGPRLSLRIGKNFGPVTAAQHGGGLYAVGGFVLPMDHPIALIKSFRGF